ncbi:hypothetical protein FHS81_000751 [Pseudochelatococcus contaminans]|uniref:Autotransporter outer membrane beta-barrel domain-containing protein n=1 Tax=Pseudochelatococcus contaminans TaxID=1538103 RepID=A0A7W5Z2P1_9HYPH|nr:hypothetical protein [Pseudochelatococcus contaminans]
MQLFTQDQFEIRGEYKAQIGDRFLSHEASLRLGVKF